MEEDYELYTKVAKEEEQADKNRFSKQMRGMFIRMFKEKHRRANKKCNEFSIGYTDYDDGDISVGMPAASPMVSCECGWYWEISTHEMNNFIRRVFNIDTWAAELHE